MARLPAHMGRPTTGEWSLTVDGLTRHACSRRSFSTAVEDDTNWFRVILVVMPWKVLAMRDFKEEVEMARPSNIESMSYAELTQMQARIERLENREAECGAH
jgi:hypothetical protein